MIERGWLKRELQEIEAEVERWPLWMKEAARFNDSHYSAQTTKSTPPVVSNGKRQELSGK